MGFWGLVLVLAGLLGRAEGEEEKEEKEEWEV